MVALTDEKRTAIAEKLAKEGAKIVANSLPYDPLDDVVASIKNQR
ncbi:MAG: hypothetical protein ACRC8K_21710 [Waterburya sp.]